MKLMSVTLEGYKRFEQRTEIDVAGNVVAMVGPNEAGKSSILQALVSVDNEQPFSNREITRRSTKPTSVMLGFILDDDDRKKLEHIPGGADIRWWTLEKGNDGILYYTIHPQPPKRDLRPRRNLGEELQRFVELEFLNQIEKIKSRKLAMQLFSPY